MTARIPDLGLEAATVPALAEEVRRLRRLLESAAEWMISTSSDPYHAEVEAEVAAIQEEQTIAALERQRPKRRQ